MSQFPKAKRQPQRRLHPDLHVFQHGQHFTSGVKPEPLCEECGDVYDRPQHQYAATPEAAKEIDSRIIGESTGEDEA